MIIFQDNTTTFAPPQSPLPEEMNSTLVGAPTATKIVSLGAQPFHDDQGL